MKHDYNMGSSKYSTRTRTSNRVWNLGTGYSTLEQENTNLEAARWTVRTQGYVAITDIN